MQATRDEPGQDVRSGTPLIAQIAWVALVAIYMAVFLAALPHLARAMRQACSAAPCSPFALRLADLPELATAGLTVAHYAAFQVLVEATLGIICAGMALVVFWRARHEWIGLLTSFTLVAFWLSFMSNGATLLAQTSLPAARLVTLLGTLGALSFAALLLVFPNGWFVPRWTRFLLILLVVLVLVEQVVVAAGFGLEMGTYSAAFLVIFLMVIFVAVGAQVYRYRRVSDPVQRQQTKWVILGMAGTALAMLAYFLLFEPVALALQPGWLKFRIAATAILLAMILLVPLTLAFAILRYRLWDIDVIVRRTLVYAALTAMLALVYFGSVTLLTSLFSRVTGQQSALAIVVSTLLIAALFSPLRRQVQNWIDRRFFRRKYDAAQVLAQFAIAARDETDLDALTAALTQVIQETLQPEHVDVWLRDQIPHEIINSEM
ncbi:MAG: hypothetical protein R2844_00455 [Caldilineales bacterium]